MKLCPITSKYPCPLHAVCPEPLYIRGKVKGAKYDNVVWAEGEPVLGPEDRRKGDRRKP